MVDVILRELVDALARGEAVALATVVDTERSTPRHAGSKMLVYGDGRTSGTIGGGEMEVRVIDEAQGALADGRPRLLQYDLVDPTRGDPGVCGGEVQLYVEPHLPTATVYVVGCGHVGKAVVELAKWLGYRVVATDDRPDAIDGLDAADAAIAGSIADALAQEPVTDQSWVVVVTRNTDLDVEVLGQLVATPAPYIGVMGSKRRWATTRAELERRGVPADQLARVVSPIGVDIRAETPEEIAVSVLAEVIQHQRG